MNKNKKHDKIAQRIYAKTSKMPSRNNQLVDIWSLVHLGTGILLGWIMSPIVAIIIMILWEPLEILVLSPILSRFGILFGYETIVNSLSDILFNCAGVSIGFWLLTMLLQPPFHLL